MRHILRHTSGRVSVGIVYETVVAAVWTMEQLV